MAAKLPSLLLNIYTDVPIKTTSGHYFSSDTCITFLPVIARAIIPLNTIVKNVHVAVKQLECFTNISGSSAVTKFGVKLPLIFTV